MPGLPPEIDTSRPHTARIYDYFLGGDNHFAADREVAEKSLASVPSGRVGAREQRAFLGPAVRYLAGEGGIRQFLDIGAGLPTTDNVHHVAQAAAPSAHVVYVDNDLCKPGCSPGVSSATANNIKKSLEEAMSTVKPTVTSEPDASGPEGGAFLVCNQAHLFADTDGTYSVQHACGGTTAPWGYLISTGLCATVTSTVSETGMIWTRNGAAQSKSEEENIIGVSVQALGELQDYISEASHLPWPGTTAQPDPHGRIVDAHLELWYGDSRNPVLACERIPLADIDLHERAERCVRRLN